MPFHGQVEDNDEAADYGISLLPALVYFENRIPSLYDADLAKVRLLDLSITITCKLHNFFYFGQDYKISCISSVVVVAGGKK